MKSGAKPPFESVPIRYIVAKRAGFEHFNTKSYKEARTD